MTKSTIETTTRVKAVGAVRVVPNEISWKSKLQIVKTEFDVAINIYEWIIFFKDIVIVFDVVVWVGFVVC